MPRPADNCSSLQKILDLTRRLAGSTDLGELLELIVRRSCELLCCERSTVFLYDDEAHELYCHVATGLTERQLRFPADAGIAGQTLTTGQTIAVPDAYADPRFHAEADKQTGFRTRNILSVPLVGLDDQKVGVLQAVNVPDDALSGEPVDLAEALAAQVAVSLQRAKLLAHYAEKIRMERAMAIAREVQQGLLPDGPPRVDGYDVAGFSRPADLTGGDAYDFIEMPGGNWLVVLADASGHGIGPALVVAQMQAMVRALAGSVEIASILARANDLLAEDLDGRFVTAVLGNLDPPSGRFTFVSAGHGPNLHVLAGEQRVVEAGGTGLPLAVLPGGNYDTETFEMSPGDVVVLCTDGFFEAENPSGEQLGIEAMQQTLLARRTESAEAILQALVEQVDAHCDNADQKDDLTAVVIKRA